ncbi:MAG: putative glycosyltransferase [Verrucomicrobiales bacterium]|jgi:putative glycosyltransferase
MKLSIVATLYRSSSFIEEFCTRVTAAAAAIPEIGNDYEIILVNDGSPDDSLAIALAEREKDDRVVVVDLSRNFGHHKAILAGLHQSRGDFVFLLDVDLEDQPEWLINFWRELTDSSPTPDVVFGLQSKRSGGTVIAFGGWLYYKTFNKISEIEVPESPTTARLMRRQYVDAVCNIQESNVYLAASFAWAGFRQLGIPVEIVHNENRSAYTFYKSLQLLITSITSFSSAPLKFISASGILISFFALSLGTYYTARKLIEPESVAPGFTSIIVSIWLVGGIILVQLGVVGYYLSRLYQEVKKRPQFLIKAVHRNEDAPAQPSNPPEARLK